jgi:hypothetical protein
MPFGRLLLMQNQTAITAITLDEALEEGRLPYGNLLLSVAVQH